MLCWVILHPTAPGCPMACAAIGVLIRVCTPKWAKPKHTTGKAGHLIHGPYERFEAGRYQLVVKGTADHWTGEEWLDIACDNGERKLLHLNLPRHTAGTWQEQCEFILDSACIDLEMRMFVSDKTNTTVEGISLLPKAPQAMVTKVGVVLVTYSMVPELLVNSVNSKYNCEWFVFHHGSSALTENIKNLFSCVDANLCFYNENRGLAKSWNEGILLSKASEKDVILVINDDVEFTEGGFDLWIDYILKNEDSGLIFVTGEEPQDDGTAIYRSQDFACFAYGKQAAELVGAFDENFTPAYFEDFDYICRAQLTGIKISVDSRILCRHRRSSTQKNDSEIREKLPQFFETNRQYFIKKWGSSQPGSGCYSHPFNDKKLDGYIPFRTD
jgi:GT2 family glycosyltransferase